LALLGVTSAKKIKEKISQIKDEIKEQDKFKKFYLFLFDYMKVSNQKKIDIGKLIF
jgi:hypothetical protein